MRLAVVGGGPKAAAIAALAECRSLEGYRTPEIVIFEPNEIGASWTGRYGFTDGEQRLCTLAERDLGFPYAFDPWHPRVSGALLNQFSWQAYLTDTWGYGDWLDRGRRPPRHQDYAKYLKWAVDRAVRTTIQIREQVVSLAYKGDWSVRTRASVHGGFDGVVITGSGPPLPPLLGADPAFVFNAFDVFMQERLLRPLLESIPFEDRKVVVIGSGGAGAASVDWLLRSGMPRSQILIVSTGATVFTRSHAYFENRLFSDFDGWNELPIRARRQALDRLTQGVVWAPVAERLAETDLVGYLHGAAKKFELLPTHELALIVDRDPGPALPGSAPPLGSVSVPATIFIDARGFWFGWFVQLLPQPERGVLQQLRSDPGWDMSLDSGFAIDHPMFPPNLHIPAFGGLVHPASTNLMALGEVAKMILDRYDV